MREFCTNLRDKNPYIFNRAVFVLAMILCATTVITAQSAAQRGGRSRPTLPPASAVTDSIPDTSAIDHPGEAFLRRYGREAADSLEIKLRSDYALCTGDSARIARDRLFRWKAQVDSMVMDPGYAEKFRTFVAATGMKAHEVRPCEPIAFHEQLERQINEMDSLITAQRAAREKAHKDSVTVERELRTLKSNPADILNIPAGMSRDAVLTIFGRHRIKTSASGNILQADQIRFEGIVVTIALYFNDESKYTGYEIETEALPADRLDTTVRRWADELSKAYRDRIGPPTTELKVGFRDIKQGRLSIVTRWDKGESRPRVLVGLATHNHLYYAKVMVSY